MVSSHLCPALIVSAPASGQGKTIFSAALACHHKKHGKRVKMFKMGPDFLDPMILAEGCGQPVHQLDLWMMGEDYCRHLLYTAAKDADLIIIEGAMGLFDGKPSTADLAQLFNIPVVALIDVIGMSQTCHAIGYGLSHFREGLPFLGIVANGITSPGQGEILLNSFHPEVEYLGGLPYMRESMLPDRYFGLVQAKDIEDLDARIESASQTIASVDLGLIPDTVRFTDVELTPLPPLLQDITIAVANDRAFSFIYQDNLDVLEEMGASLSFFSPLEDNHLPECDALYLPGGYPELNIKTLAANKNMRHSIRRHYESAKVIYAECGGMMYLLDSVTNLEGHSETMIGLLPGRVIMQKKLMAFGYQSFVFNNTELRGRAFHYSQLLTKLTPRMQAKRKDSDEAGEALYELDHLRASYLYCYFRSYPEAAAALFLP